MKKNFSSIVTARWCCNRLHDFALLNFVYCRYLHLCCTGKKNLNFEKSSYVYKLDSLYTTVYMTKMFFMVNVANFLCLKRPS